MPAEGHHAPAKRFAIIVIIGITVNSYRTVTGYAAFCVLAGPGSEVHHRRLPEQRRAKPLDR
eukprot:593871-Hanusia_phi.AAC.1